MGKVKTFTREEALALARAGRRVRPPRWPVGYMFAIGSTIWDDEGDELLSDDVIAISPECATGWTLLARTKAELRAALAKETERAEAAEAAQVKLQEMVDDKAAGWSMVLTSNREYLDEANRLRAALTAAEERAKVAEAEVQDLKQGHIGPAIRMADLQLSLKLQAEERGTALQAEVATLAAECERLRAVAPKFAVGDRVTVGHMGVVRIVESFDHVVRYEGGGWDMERNVRPAPDAKPAEPVWHPCSAAEAREKHAAGMRVRHEYWAEGDFIRNGECRAANWSNIYLKELALDHDVACWQWSEPLPETEGGAGHG